MAKFWELLEESVLVSGTIALSCVGSVVYLACSGKPIPDILVNITMIVVGFFFGGKVQQAQGVIAERMEK
jgi:hypothetical protein